MNCTCGAWRFFTVAEIDGRDRVVKKCIACGKIEREESGNGMARTEQ
jgi:hypothetical protein